MGFLDNLENNLNALERIEERDPEQVKRDRERREAERNEALSRAPFVDALKTSPFTSDLLTACRTVGRTERVLVQFTWIGESLRLDAKSKRMELVPSAKGIDAVYSEDGTEKKREPIDFEREDPTALATRWLKS